MSDAPFPCLGDIIAGKNMEWALQIFPCCLRACTCAGRYRSFRLSCSVIEDICGGCFGNPKLAAIYSCGFGGHGKSVFLIKKIKKERQTGLEPATLGLGSPCSAN